MGRTKKTPFPTWLTRKPNGIEERYIRIGNSQMISEAALHLEPTAFKIYYYMNLESGGKQTFKFPHCKYQAMMTKQTFVRNKKILIEKGFIEEVQNNKNLRIANVYRFSDKWKEWASPP